MSKKGIIFSLIAIGLSGLFIILFATTHEQSVDQRNDIIRTRVNTLDRGVDAFYDYAEEAQAIAGRGALFSLYDEIALNRAYLADFELSLEQCMNDTGTCGNQDNLSILLENYTKLMESSLNAEVDFAVNSITMISEDFWSITVRGNISLSVTDTYATWESEQLVTSTISTIGTYDPSFVRLNDMYGGNEERRIYFTSIAPYSSHWNNDTFMAFYKGRLYQVSQRGACLSERYEGTFTSPYRNCNIETLVDADEHPGLLADVDVTHIAYQVLEGETHQCHEDDTEDGDGIEDYRVALVGFEEDHSLVLWVNDTRKYGLYPDNLLYDANSARFTAPGCTGYP